ncbi:hypothetical protein HK100_002515 [Physocladia obscura]|uniref:AB hydrolase-1 domain-containing protein n=1 Tax=Physocladia obscura TaxID=109957 RepID=A0AAD5SVK0_9FUNG|nr:hypothetical protein HK100_002515 [Physocladia obscura]
MLTIEDLGVSFEKKVQSGCEFAPDSKRSSLNRVIQHPAEIQIEANMLIHQKVSWPVISKTLTSLSAPICQSKLLLAAIDQLVAEEELLRRPTIHKIAMLSVIEDRNDQNELVLQTKFSSDSGVSLHSWGSSEATEVKSGESIAGSGEGGGGGGGRGHTRLLETYANLMDEISDTLHEYDTFVIRATTIVAADRGAPVELYHELHGHGSHKVLFITGWAGSCDNWRFQTEFFGHHGAFEVCIYENRGSGFSSDPKTQYAMRDMAQDAVDLMDQLGWESAHVVGVSMGGMVCGQLRNIECEDDLQIKQLTQIAQELALLAPSRIQSLTLSSTSASRSLPPLRYIPWIIATFTKILLGLEKVKNMMPFFLYSQRWLNAPAPPNTGFSSNLEYMLKFHGGRIDSRPPQSFIAAIRQLCGIISFHISKQRLTELRNYFLHSRIPALVIHGTEDALVHLRASWNLASSLGARLVVFEGRGHALNHEDIDLFNRILLRHFYSAILGTADAVVGQPQQQLFSATNLEVEQRAKAMIENLKRQMVGFRAWICWLFGKTWDASAIVPIVEWLPFAQMKSEQKPELQAKINSTTAVTEKAVSEDGSVTTTAVVSHIQDHTGVLTSAVSRMTAEISHSEK